MITVSLPPTILATSTSIPLSFKDFKVTVTKIEMSNDVSFVTIFSGPPTELDLVNGGTFPGISALPLPAGTYNKIKVTFRNSLPVTGPVVYAGRAYYTTGATFGGTSNVASDPSNTSGSQTVFTFRISDWGHLMELLTGNMTLNHLLLLIPRLSAHLKIHHQQYVFVEGNSGQNFDLLFDAVRTNGEYCCAVRLGYGGFKSTIIGHQSKGVRDMNDLRSFR